MGKQKPAPDSTKVGRRRLEQETCLFMNHEPAVIDNVPVIIPGNSRVLQR